MGSHSSGGRRNLRLGRSTHVQQQKEVMPLQIHDLPAAIRTIKQDLQRALPRYAEVFREVENDIRQKVAEIVRDRDAGANVIPTVKYDDIEADAVAPAT